MYEFKKIYINFDGMKNLNMLLPYVHENIKNMPLKLSN